MADKSIQERLRHEADQWHPSEKSPIRELRAGADEIDRLRSAAGEMVKALETARSLAEWLTGSFDLYTLQSRIVPEARDVSRKANAALSLAKAAGLSKADGAPPRFPDTFCSSCGKSFGPGNHGYSHCENHAHLVGRD